MILAILQARVSSTRLPEKVLAPILGKPMILRQIERIGRSELIDRLLLATSTDPSDDPLADLCRKEGVEIFRGDLDDVLDRFYRAARTDDPEHVVRLTGDCPLIDPWLIDRVIEFHMEGGYDYTANALEPTYPDGLDVEIMRFSVLEKSWREAKLPSEREHVTPFLQKDPERFRIGSVKNEQNLSHLRWTVDEPRDLELVRRIYEALYPQKPDFLMEDVLVLLEEHPQWKTINRNIPRNEGLEKSLREDRAYLEQQKENE